MDCHLRSVYSSSNSSNSSNSSSGTELNNVIVVPVHTRLFVTCTEGLHELKASIIDVAHASVRTLYRRQRLRSTPRSHAWTPLSCPEYTNITPPFQLAVLLTATPSCAQNAFHKESSFSASLTGKYCRQSRKETRAARAHVCS